MTWGQLSKSEQEMKSPGALACKLGSPSPQTVRPRGELRTFSRDISNQVRGAPQSNIMGAKKEMGKGVSQLYRHRRYTSLSLRCPLSSSQHPHVASRVPARTRVRARFSSLSLFRLPHTKSVFVHSVLCPLLWGRDQHPFFCKG